MLYRNNKVQTYNEITKFAKYIRYNKYFYLGLILITLFNMI